ncbi:MAG: hypothetical protein JL50_06210 [Peptococcaceae bacterium BICA1-7]|nr:MAG: hypothetical protein JL50_06210 [Peptococcaceae bacterium BICA1-7]
MNELPLFECPCITDDDVAWVCELLRLPENAFSGADGNDPRMEILKSNETLDIEACPGSGKTTLLVAKLAILARKWTDPHRGICVLSHTNVARREIEQRLGNTAEGERLLSYPHFVGTIHGFVNEFLAIPWLRSLGYPVNFIDNERCEQHRRRLLNRIQFRALGNYVNRREDSGKHNVVSKWCVVSSAFDVLKEDNQSEFKDDTKPAARQLMALAERTVRDGYHRYDEMFMWAHDLLDQVPEVQDAIRGRFPLLFIDEVQDNSESQSVLLFRLFMDGNNPVVRQRLGDSNQAIYLNAYQTVGATTDKFPDACIKKDIPNSHRFGMQIAHIADPLALAPQNLVGCGPSSRIIRSDLKNRHAIFLFNDQTIEQVMNVYADYLLMVFSKEDLREGIFTAVGGVHRPGGDDHLPRSVGQYWKEYDHELTAAEPRPKSFLQYLRTGYKLVNSSGEAHHLVEKVADGLLRLASLSNPSAGLCNRRRKHRYVLELLADNPDAIATYRDLIMFLAVERSVPSMDDWTNKWSDAIVYLAEAICGVPPDPTIAKEFLEWELPDQLDHESISSLQRGNIFRYPAVNPQVQIRMGSIHSVKGETHTATLVMETYYYEHHLAKLKPWLLGKNWGKGKEGNRIISSLKQHYVAMTRPSHLLCLAMREDTFSLDELNQLKSITWKVARVIQEGPVWL